MGGAADAMVVHSHQRDGANIVRAGAAHTPVCKDEAEEELLWEVVHHKGTCYRSTTRWNATVPKGFVPRGAVGVVAETSQGDTTYIRPEGTRYWLPVKGLSASVKILHLERRPR